MFRNLFRAALVSFVQRWLDKGRAPREQSPLRIDADELRAFSIKTASLISLVLLNFLLFVGAIVVTVVAAAHSIEIYGHFESTPVFRAGILMGGTALLLGALSGWALANLRVELRDFIITEALPENDLGIQEHLVTPFLEGLAEGLRRAPSGMAYRDSDSRPAA
jgi:hypothetical protein